MHGMGAVTALNAGSVEASPRLVKAAREFEAQMMKELLKPMTEAGAEAGEEEEGESGGALREFAAEAFGEALSARGGLGIAKEIVKSLGQSAEPVATQGQPGQGVQNRTSVAPND